jgi:hypothetical protein
MVMGITDDGNLWNFYAKERREIVRTRWAQLPTEWTLQRTRLGNAGHQNGDQSGGCLKLVEKTLVISAPFGGNAAATGIILDFIGVSLRLL